MATPRFGSLLAILSFSLACVSCSSSPQQPVVVSPPAHPPHIFFACCDQGSESLNTLLANPQLFSDLQDLHAGLAVALDDLSPQRAQFVQRLNQAGIPAIAWLVLPREQGYYVNAGNAPQAAERFADFDVWTQQNHLRWQAVGLDIEPNFEEFKLPKSRLFVMLLRRAFDRSRVDRPRQAYSALIQNIRAHGYPVQTYQMFFLADERKAHSTLLERLFGLVDVRGDEEVLMVYTSFNHKAGSAVVWSYGPDTQTVAVGSTLASGDPQTDVKFGPLNWEEFSRDLLVASHFSSDVGVYSLEGCLRQGFLPRLKAMDWQQGVMLPAAKVAGMRRFRFVIQAILWTASRLLYFLLALVLLIALFIVRRRRRARAAFASA